MRRSRAGLQPVELLGDLSRPDVDQAAALNLSVLARGQGQLVNRYWRGIDDYELVDMTLGVVRELCQVSSPGETTSITTAAVASNTPSAPGR